MSAEVVYTYTNEVGDMLFQVVRQPGKKFIQRRPKHNNAFRSEFSDNGEWQAPYGWDYRLEGVRRVIYRLPEVAKAIKSGQDVWIVEGEKDADNLCAAGVTATCNPGGALKWSRPGIHPRHTAAYSVRWPGLCPWHRPTP